MERWAYSSSIGRQKEEQEEQAGDQMQEAERTYLRGGVTALQELWELRIFVLIMARVGVGM